MLRQAAQGARPDLARETLSDDVSTSPCEQPPAAPGTLAPPSIGKYVVVGILGEGGQAVVYRAVNPGLNKELVLKVSRRPVLPERADRDHLVREARLLADLDHPNLARVYDVDFWQDRPFVVMEYVRGRTLAECLRQKRPGPPEAAALVAQLARAMAAAHRAGVIHLDLKPSNIMIDEAGRPRILDFGLARMSHAYLGECARWFLWRHAQLHGPRSKPAPIRKASARAATSSPLEVFCMKCWQAGRPSRTKPRSRPCNGPGGATSTVPRLGKAGVPRTLERICLKAMAAEAAQRYAQAEDLAADLERYVNRPRRVKWAVAAGVGLAFLLIAGYWSLIRPVEFPPGSQRVIAQVQREEKSLDFPLALPLRSSDRFRIDCLLPHGFQPRLFSRDVDGKWEEYSQFEVKREGRFDRLRANIRWPGKGAGTRVVLICAGRSSPPPALEEMKKTVLSDERPWATLPPSRGFWMNRDAVRSDVARGMAEGERTAEDRVEDRLEQLRLQLLDHCDYFAGVAYPQAD